MAYQVGPNGLPMVRGLALPLSPEQMAAAGLSPEQAPGGIPMPGPNPYGGLPANAVAGPGGAPVDMGGGADDAIRMAAGSGQGPQLSQSDLARLTTPQPVDRSHAAAPSRSDQLLSAGSKEKAGESSPKLLPTVGEAQRAADGPSIDPNAQLAVDWQLRHSGGGPRRLAETGETQKYTEYGTVPQELTKDITAKQEALDKERAAVAESAYTGQADALARQREAIVQQEKDAAEAERQRQLVNQRIDRLQATSEAQEAALAQSTPKQASEFFGGNTGASILAALAVGLGAMGQARTGGPNAGKEIIDGAINRWVNDQRQAYDAAKDKATLANNAYKNALEIFGTPEAAESQIRLQALAAKNAMAMNVAEQTKNDQVRQNALLMIQNDQLTRQQLRAQAIQQAGMKEIESKNTMLGGPGSGGNPYVLASKAGAEVTANDRAITGTTNEDLRTGIEAQKAQASGAHVANTAAAAAEAAERFREKASTFAGRAPGAGKGELEAARADAEAKYTAYLVASGGASARNAAEIASKFYAGKGDAIRGPSADAALDAHIKTLRGNEIRARAAHAAGITPESSEPEGEPE